MKMVGECVYDGSEGGKLLRQNAVAESVQGHYSLFRNRSNK